MRKVLIELFLLAIGIGLTLEVIKSAIPYLLLIWLVILAHYTWEIISSERVKDFAKQVKGRLSKKQLVFARILLGLAGIGLLGIYWWGLNLFFTPRIAKYEAEQRDKRLPNSPEKPDGPKKDDPPKTDRKPITPKKTGKVLPPREQRPVLEVYVSLNGCQPEAYRFKAYELEFKNLDELRKSAINTVNGKRHMNCIIPPNENAPVSNVVLRNIGDGTLRNARTSIMSNVRIKGETQGVSVFDSHQISYETPTLHPYENLGEESSFSVRTETADERTVVILQIVVAADNLKKYAALANILYEKVPPK